jgi:hypothetical protein
MATRTRKNCRKPNGSDEAAAARLSEQFHGRPARTVRDVAEVYDEPTVLADLGKLIELHVRLADGSKATLGFPDNVRLASTPEGGSLYLVGGDQSLDLKRLGLDEYLPKDHVIVGLVQRIVYFTSKAFHNFEPTEYTHKFGEEGGGCPTLVCDVRSRKLYLIGGSYVVKPEGIRN